MQRLEVSGAVRLIYKSLGVKGLNRVKEEMNILHTVIRRKANWIGHILRRNCLLHRVILRK